MVTINNLNIYTEVEKIYDIKWHQVTNGVQCHSCLSAYAYEWKDYPK